MDVSQQFLEVEKLFTDEMYRATSRHKKNHYNICCEQNEENHMVFLAHTIKGLDEYKSMSYRDIIVVLIYLYYSLRFNEQSDDWLRQDFLDKTLIDKALGTHLFQQIMGGDIWINLSSAIRRYILGMKTTGGKRKSNRSIIKRNKKRRQTRKTRKTIST